MKEIEKYKVVETKVSLTSQNDNNFYSVDLVLIPECRASIKLVEFHYDYENMNN